MNRFNYFFTPAIILLLLILLPGCGETEKERQKRLEDSLAVRDSILRIEQDSIKNAEYESSYLYYPVFSAASFDSLAELLGEVQLGRILSINRLDAQHVRIGDTLVIPAVIKENLLFYSPFPASLPKSVAIPKLIFFDYRIQAFAVYTFGSLIRWGPTSMGKRSTQTPTGLFHTNWKAKETISTVNSEWILPWAFNFDNFEGVSMHQFDMPGYPASHACCRLLIWDAIWFYDWADQWILTKDGSKVLAHGTPLIIYGEYKWGEHPPWKSLPLDSKAVQVSEAELTEELSKYYDKILHRTQSRDSLLQSISLNKEY